MKKMIALVLAALLVLSLAACGEVKETEDSTANKDKELEIAVVWNLYADVYQSGFRTMMNEEAEKLGITMNHQDGENDVGKFSNKLDTLISRGYEWIGVIAGDRQSTEIHMEKLKANDLPIFFINLEPLPEVMEAYDKAWYVGSPASESGEMSAQVLCNYWLNNTEKADKNGDGILQLVIIEGPPGNNDVILRTQAYHDTLEKNGIQYEVVKEDTANWDTPTAADKMSTYITELGEKGIEGVLCNNDAMAMGALSACKLNGWNQEGSDVFIPICGIDANNDALEALKAGELLGTCLNDRRGKSRAFLNLVAALYEGKTEITAEDIKVDGATVDGRYIWIPYVPVSAENVLDVIADVR